MSKYADLDNTVFEWYKRIRASKPEVGINGPIILRKAEYFATLHGYNDFKPSSGWLDRWKNRYNLRFLTMSGESEKVDDLSSNLGSLV